MRTSFFVPADLPLTEATMLLDIMGTGGHALARAQAVRPDIEHCWWRAPGRSGWASWRWPGKVIIEQ